MFDPTSRYAEIEEATMETAEGREIRYLKRRFLPDGRLQPTLQEITVAQSDRSDLIAARTLGEATQSWRIADANNAMDPLELTEEPGRKLKVAVPQPPGER
jgi:hypothetical protein